MYSVKSPSAKQKTEKTASRTLIQPLSRGWWNKGVVLCILYSVFRIPFPRINTLTRSLAADMSRCPTFANGFTLS